MARQEQLELEVLRNMMRSGGLNLAGQPQPGSYGYYSPDFSYGSYKIPYQDPTYSSGYEYARTIAGGMPFEDVVAPGMSFSPDQPMGYTQEDLMPKFVGEGPVPVMPSAPTKGTPVEASYETMPDAPVGTPMPTKFIPGQTAFTEIPDFLKDLDFGGLPRVQEPVEPREDFFQVDQNLLNFEEIADKIDMDEVAKIDIEKIDIPESVSLFSDVLNQPVETQPTLPSIFDQPTAPVMPTMPMEPMVQPITAPVIPAQTLPQNIFADMPAPQRLPMPIIPRFEEPRPIPSFIQPSVEEIVSPISRGRTRQLPQPGLFSLV